MEQVPVYIAEITPKHVRGTFTFSNQVILFSFFSKPLILSYRKYNEGRQRKEKHISQHKIKFDFSLITLLTDMSKQYKTKQK